MRHISPNMTFQSAAAPFLTGGPPSGDQESEVLTERHPEKCVMYLSEQDNN